MKPMRSAPFLTRLGRDTGGNTLAIMAAAFFPLAGLIGGGVDISRIYITKTRLQQACDAGALAGRKTMGSGSWTTSGSNNSRGHAYQLFAANFQEGDFGTGEMTREFTESDGTVTGEASASVPMTIMKIFGKSDHEVEVTCTAEMEIPNTDVMFVLDVTSSMNCEVGCAYSENEQSDAKIKDLRSAVKCFYEALLKVDTDEPCTAADPTASSYTGTAQIRLGFVPYAVNVNVGKLLPHSFLAGEWNYQSREANYTTVHSWSAAPPGSIDWGEWSDPPALTSAADYSGWTDLSTSGGGTVTVDGVSLTKRPNGYNSTTCDSLNTMGPSGNRMRLYDDDDDGDLGSATLSGAAPVYPETDQEVTYTQEDEYEVRGYRYRWGTSGTDSCRLQRSNLRTYTLEREGNATRSVVWTDYDRLDTWTYDQFPIDVSGLKHEDGSAWNSTLAISRRKTESVTVKLSGSNSNSTFDALEPLTATWDGCIEELPTHQNTDRDPSDEWDPIPAAALDLRIDPPEGSQWGPLLPDAFWGRYTGTNTNNRTRNPVTTSANLNRNMSGGISDGYYCPEPSRKLTEYTTPDSFESYITGLRAHAIGTYHDIGLLWGARLISPTGIFGSENALTEDGGAIERHVIFMTDGDAQTYVNNLYAYGSAWWDLRQTSYNPETNHLTALVNERTETLCTQIKNMNIKLWVISYGDSDAISDDNEERLSECASPGHYHKAENRAGLISRFQQIASEIADLRLTQ